MEDTSKKRHILNETIINLQSNFPKKNKHRKPDNVRTIHADFRQLGN